MPLQDDLTAVQQRPDDPVRAPGATDRRIGRTLDVRRVRADADRPPESPASPRASARDRCGTGPHGREQEIVTVPDTPYDRSLWNDAEDEGPGARDRRAP